MSGRLAALLRGAPDALRHAPAELPALARFLAGGPGRAALAARFYRITALVDCPHRQSEVFEVADAILRLDVPGHVVEAGAYRGGSAAKLSLACARAGRRLRVFDGFEGIPPNDEVMDEADVLGSRSAGPARFEAGAYAASERELRATLARFGAPAVCEVIAGRFADTLPRERGPVAVAFVDVDLAASTRDCLRGIWPRLSPGGALFSHDGHLPLVRAVLADPDTWRPLGGPPARVVGLGRRRLVRLEKGE
ncbi:MAG: TylF/MycF/NovP-related O-methyltransferase [Myxococcota bacterium]|nr:TylF/MycF/NovP-related O-methyltransferase [Myxococcota bacterium]